ncbi:Vacuolar protein sorting-associated protein Ist1 [Dillenia turbinata]|uniref:Vacuolar protein sorting-associated protein Ist1 n=1 Tax=Dillenia turbinata TaxID=194707 RepID=A0AAN8VWH8_9MAGN
MLDGLLGRSFSSKCKSSIKVTRTRIDGIRRKKNATLKFLKKDIADLLANGLDINAYGRFQTSLCISISPCCNEHIDNHLFDIIVSSFTLLVDYDMAEGLLAELTHTYCYDFVEQSCECVLQHLSVMQKQSECPEDCREAVSSLMFAAARFADLPELRDLRNFFQEKYGNFLEYFVNKQFIENLGSNNSTRERKIQLLRGIASEFSISWDCEGFEQRMANCSTPAQDKLKKNLSFNVPDKTYKLPSDADALLRRNKSDTSSAQKYEFSYDSHTNDGHGLHSKRESTASQREEQAFKLFARPDLTENGHQQHNRREEIEEKRSNHVLSFEGMDVTPNRYVVENRKEEIDSRKVKLGSPLRGRGLGCLDGGYALDTSNVNSTPKVDRHGTPRHAKLEFSPSHTRHQSSGDGVRDSPMAGSNHPNGKYSLHKKQTEKNLSQGRPELSPTPIVRRTKEKSYHNDGSSEACDSQYNVANSTRKVEAKYDSHATPELPFTPSVRRTKEKSHYHHISVGGEPHDAQHGTGNSTRKVVEEERDDLKPTYHNSLPPPYVKPRKNKSDAILGSQHPGFDSNEAPKEPATHDRANGSARRSERVQIALDHDNPKEHMSAENVHDHEKVYQYHQDEMTNEPRRRSKSSRRRHLKSSSSHDYDGYFDDAGVVRRKSSSRRREEPRRGLQVLFDEDHYRKDEEERMIDKLLLHYSKKPSTLETDKVQIKSKAHSSRFAATKEGEPFHYGDIDKPDVKLEMFPPPGRSVSLPHEQASTSETTKVFTRSTSFQPEMLNHNRHVHPKLPDYDDLAARFAALKGR